MKVELSFLQRLAVTIVAVLVTSYLTSLFWEKLTGAALPNYLAGLVGGIVALPVWELLRRARPSRKD